MIRKIIHIDKEKCNGCGLCADACHEGAIEIKDGKATLVRDDYCDGFGDCLPGCPTGAITFEEREAAAYDEEAVKARKREQARQTATGCMAYADSKQTGTDTHICTAGTNSKLAESDKSGARACTADAAASPAGRQSQLAQWPTQIKLMPIKAPYYDGSKLLVAADCTAFAYASIHEDFMKGHITINGCPKLDAVDYSEKLGQIISQNNISVISVVRMEVPCCGGLEYAVKRAIEASGKNIPLDVTVISIRGDIVT